MRNIIQIYAILSYDYFPTFIIRNKLLSYYTADIEGAAGTVNIHQINIHKIIPSTSVF